MNESNFPLLLCAAIANGLQVVQRVIQYYCCFSAGNIALRIELAAGIEGSDLVFQRPLNAALIGRVQRVCICKFNWDKIYHRQVTGLFHSLNQHTGIQLFGNRLGRIDIGRDIHTIIMGIDEGFGVPGIVFYFGEQRTCLWCLIEINRCQAKLETAGDKLYPLRCSYCGCLREIGCRRFL